MNILPLFEEYLASGKKPASSATVKNYLADARLFEKWYSETFKSDISPSSITQELISDYIRHLKSSQTSSSSSIDRRLSSLNKFAAFLSDSGYIKDEPSTEARQIKSDEWRLGEFVMTLRESNASDATVKNYMSDIKQFINWFAKSYMAQNDLSSQIDQEVLDEYKELLETATLSPSSINRKLSSLRRYLGFLGTKTIIESVSDSPALPLENPTHHLANNSASLRAQSSDPSDSSQIDVSPTTSNKRYSSLPPLRMLQKLGTASTLAFDASIVALSAVAVEKMQYLSWIALGKQVFSSSAKNGLGFGDRILQFTKELTGAKVNELGSHPFVKPLSPLKPSTLTRLHPSHPSFADLPTPHRLIGHAKYTRPAWYKRYHSYAIVHYFHFAALIIIMGGIGFGLYRSFILDASQNKLFAAPPTAPPRILSFQGRLTDNLDNPITTAKDLRFAIYNSSAATGAALLWQETQKITGDQDGIFSSFLGSSVVIPSSVFTDNSTLYLGVTVQSDPELAPRQQIATVAFAANSETLQGLLPITAAGATQQNVVLALDSSGNLTIGGSATPTFSATGGAFTLSGTVLNLQTTSGSNSNININPDGRGLIELQKPIRNSTLNNNIPSAAGAVEIDDMLAVLATSAAQNAVTIVQAGAGPIFSASSGATTRLLLANNGTITASGYSTGVAQFSSTGVLSSSALNLAGGASFISGQLPVTNGGTGLASVTTGDLLYGSGVNTISALPIGASGRVLTVSGGLPSWIDPAALSSSYWQRNLGALSPANITDDLLIGASSSNSATFHVFGFSKDAGAITSGTASTSGDLTFGGASAQDINILNGNALNIKTSGGGDAGLASKLTLTNDGNLGIGTTIPNSKLQISNGSATISNGGFVQIGADSGRNVEIKGNSAAAYIDLADATGTDYDTRLQSNTDKSFQIQMNGSVTPSFFIKADGNVGVGTTTPIAKFHVDGRVTGRALATLNETGNQDIFTASAAGTPRFVITNAGNVGIGTILPQAPLDVVGDIYGSSGISLYNTAVSDDTIEAAKFCTGDGETNCVTDFSALVSGASYWSRSAGNLSPTTLNDTIAATSGASTVATFTTNNPGGTLTNNTLIQHTGAGTITNLLNLTRTAGTATNALAITGTFTNLISTPTFVLNNAGAASGLTGLASTGTIAFTGAGSFTIDSSAFDVTSGGAVSGVTTLTSSGSTTIGTGASSANTMGAGASSTNVIGSVTTPGALTLHGATTLDNTFTVSGSNLTSLGGNLTVTGTAWTATPTISGLITATSGLTANGALTANNVFALGDNGDLGSIDTSDWDISTTGALTNISGITTDGAYTQSGTGINSFSGNVGVGTTSPLGILDARGLSTTSIATISGTTSNASLAVDNNGVGDLFVASKSGATKFVVKNSGNVGIGTSLPSQLFDVQGGSGIVANFSGRVVGANAGAANEFVTLSQLTGGTGQYWTRIAGNLSPTTLNDTFSATSSAFTVATHTTNNPGGTITDNTLINHTGAGTITNLLNLTRTAGTATNALAITGTFTNLISTPTFVLNNAGAASGLTGLASTGTIAFTGAGSFTIDSSAFDVTSGGAVSGVTTLTSSGSTTIGTGASSANTVGAGASSTNVIGSVTTPGALTLHGATTLDNTFTVSGSNLTTLGGNLTVTGTAWTATPTISGLITATSGVSVAAGQSYTGAGAVTLSSGGGAGLTLDSASNTLTIASSDTTLTASGLTTISLGTSATINAGATALNLQADGGGINVNIAGGSGSTGCTVTNASGDLTCTGSITGSGGALTNLWQRIAGNISPVTLNDTISATTSAAVALTLTQTGAFNALLVEDQASDASPFIIDQSGNVGIGTTSVTAGAELDVNGDLVLAAGGTIDARASGTIVIGNGANTSGLTLGKAGATTTFNSTAWTATPTISGLITATSGLTANGALTANNVFTLGDNGDTGVINTSDWDIDATGVATGISGITTDGAYTQSGTGINSFSGNVGLGTTIPNSRLDVRGTSSASTGVASFSASIAPTADMVTISNGSFPITTAGVNALGIDYFGGNANVEAAAQRINLTPGTNNGTWSGFRLVGNAAGSGVTENGLKLELNSAGAGTENAIFVGANWDNVLNVNGTVVINGSGITQVAGGGTGFGSYSVGDILYASGATAFTKRTIGSTGDILTVSGGVPTWVSVASLGLTNLWQRALGAVSPANITDDLLIGGSASTSAVFQVFGLSKDAGAIAAGTASTSGDLTFRTASSDINLLNNASLSIKTSVGGDAGLTTRLILNSAGNVGIGTTAPIGLLHVEGRVTGRALAQFIETGDQDIFTASAGATPRFVIRNNGNVGIGTMLPGQLLSVAGFIEGQRFVDSSNNSFFLDPAATATSLTTAGWVGIGTSNPVTFFQIDGATTTAQGQALASINQTGAADVFTASTSGTTRFVIKNDGNVGIGTTTPVGLFNVEGRKTGLALTLFNETGNQDIFTASASGSTKFTIGNNGDIILGGRDLAAIPVSGVLRAMSTTGTNQGGANLYLAAGNGTGTGNGGDMIFRTGQGATSSAALVNSFMRDQSSYVSNGPGLTFNHTVGGSNAVLVVGVAYRDTATITVRYRGVALTEIDTERGSAGQYVRQFYMANPDPGTGQIHVFSSDTTQAMAASAVTLNNVNTATPFTNTNFNTGSSVTPSVAVTSAQNDIVVGITAHNDTGGCTVGSFEEELADVDSGLATDPGLCSDSEQAGTTSTTISHTTSNQPWTIRATAFRPLPTTQNSAIAEMIRLTQNGNIGIQNSSPAASLDIQNTSGSPERIITRDASGTIKSRLGYVDTKGTGAGNIFLYDTAGTLQTFITGGTSNSYINTSNLGLGTTSPTVKLDIGGDNGTLVRLNTTGGAAIINFQASSTNKGYLGLGASGTLFGNATTDSMSLRGETDVYLGTGGVGTGGIGSNTIALSINNRGNVGIGSAGTSSTFPRAQLDIAGNASSSGDMYYRGSSTTIAQLNGGTYRWVNSPGGNSTLTEVMRINKDGFVGMGTAAPLFQLHVAQNNSASAAAMIENISSSSTSDGLIIKTGGNTIQAGNHWIEFQAGNTGIIKGSIQGDGTTGTTYKTSGIADFAEYMLKDMNESIPWGALLCQAPNGKVTQCSSSNNSLIGVASEHPSFVGGVEGPDRVTVGLVGVVETQVSTENGSIKPGDPITLSSTTGVGAKATKTSQTVGRAIGSYSGNGIGKIYVTVNTGYYNPDIYLAQSGNFNITGNDEQSFQAWAGGYKFESKGGFADAAIARLTAGIVKTQQLIVSGSAIFLGSVQMQTLNVATTISAGSVSAGTAAFNSLTIGGQALSDYVISVVQNAGFNNSSNLVAPIANIDIIHTDIISPLATDQVIIDGNASVSGNLSATNLSINGDATISGTLRADRILANDIEGLNARIASIAANTITASSAAITNIYNNTYVSSGSAIASGGASMIASSIETNFANIGSLSANLAYVPSLTSEFGTFSQGLMSFGATSLADTAIAGQLSVNGSLILADNTINTLGSPLEIQPLRQGALSFMGGLVAIDIDGNLSVAGNATFAKDVTVQGKLAVGIISPVPSEDLILQLPGYDDGTTLAVNRPSIAVKNGSGSAVLKITDVGDIIASGAALASEFQVVRGALADTSINTSIATASAGTATIKAGQLERTIQNARITANSLIYITAASDTSGKTPFVARQVAEDISLNTKGSFTIRIPQAISTDAKVNWWIIN